MAAEEERLVVYSGEHSTTIEGYFWVPGVPKLLAADVAALLVGKHNLRYRLASLTNPCKTCGHGGREGEYGL